jgi:hypothetical protein
MWNVQHATKNVAISNEVELTDEQLESVVGGDDDDNDDQNLIAVGLTADLSSYYDTTNYDPYQPPVD